MSNKCEEEKIDAEPRGIKGWLIIPAIGLVLAPVKSIVFSYLGIRSIQTFTPELLNDPRLWISTGIEFVLLVSIIYVTILFFQKKRFVPKAMVALMLVVIAASIIQTFFNVGMFNTLELEILKPVISNCVYGAIWIPYFLKSKRVKKYIHPITFDYQGMAAFF